jgi:hypothetical protein
VQLLEIAKPHLLTVAEYMTLDIEGRTELIGGVIYDVSPRNEPHRYAVRKLTEALVLGFARRYIVQVQDAVAVPGWQCRDAPEIDVAVIGDKFYRPGPTSADAFAFIEVADTTYIDDRNEKIPLYVSAGVPSWIINIPSRRVEFYVDDLALEHGHVSTEERSTCLGGDPRRRSL